MKKTVSLLRVSSDMQDFNSQKTGIEEYCKRNHIVIDEWIEEFDTSGYSTKLEDRTGLQKIKQMAINGEIDTLIVFNQDRIGRDTGLLQYILFLNQLEVKIISTMEGEINALDINSQFMSYVKLWMAENESIKTSNRVKNGILAKNKKNEYPGGKTPYGYSLVDGKLIINKEEAAIVKELFELSIDYGSYIILNKFKEKGYRKRGYEWGISGVNYTLQNTIYTGYIRYNFMHEINKDKTDKTRKKDLAKMQLQDYNLDLQIIDQELFDKVQKAIKNRNKTKNKTVRQNMKTKQLLENLIYHKCWDGSLHSMYVDYNYHKNSKVVTPIYLCINCKRNKPKGTKIKQSVVTHKIHEEFEKAIYDLMENIDTEELRKDLEKKLNKSSTGDKNKLRDLKDLLVKKKKALTNANVELEKIFLEESDMSASVINNLITKLDEDITEAESELSFLQQKINKDKTCNLDIDSIIYKYKKFNEIYTVASLQDKKRILREIIDKVIWSAEEDTLEIIRSNVI